MRRREWRIRWVGMALELLLLPRTGGIVVGSGIEAASLRHMRAAIRLKRVRGEGVGARIAECMSRGVGGRGV